MSGTSLDGVDAALTSFSTTPGHGLKTEVLSTFSLPFSPDLRQELLALNVQGVNEIERSALAGNQLAILYAQAIKGVISEAGVDATQISAIGCHGQTIRHRPSSVTPSKLVMRPY